MKSKVIKNDCLIELKKLKSNSIVLSIFDPPYNIKIDEWDNIGDIEIYIKWLELILIEVIRVTKPNGSIYIFGDFKYIGDIKSMLNNKEVFLNSWIIWDKGTKAQNSTRSYVNNLEHILFYVKGFNKDLEIPTELNSVRDYMKNEKKKSKLSNKELSLMFSKFYNKQGKQDRSVVEHYFTEKQWIFPTKEIYNEILQKTGFFNVEYENLKNEYDKLRFVFNVDDIRIKRNPNDTRSYKNEKQLMSNIWYYNNKKECIKYDHPTVKPLELIKTIVKASSNETDVVLDCFGGSGTTAETCLLLNRKFIIIEKEQKYIDIIYERISKYKLFNF